MVADHLEGLRVEVLLDGQALVVASLGAVQHRKLSRDPHILRPPAIPTARHTRELADGLFRAAFVQVAAEALDRCARLLGGRSPADDGHPAVDSVNKFNILSVDCHPGRRRKRHIEVNYLI